MALLVAYSPDVWNTEKPMDMAFVNAANRARLVPAARPVAGRRATSTTTTSATSRWRCVVRLTGVEPTRATTSRSRCSRAHRAAPCSRSAARCGRRARAAPAPRAGRWRRARRGRRCCVVLGNLAGARRADRRRRRRCATTTGSPPSRVVPGDDQRVPVVLVPARRPARARARAAVHAAGARRSRCRSRSPGPRARRGLRGRRGARRRRSRSGCCTRSTRGRIRWWRALLVLAVAAWLRDPAQRAGAGGARSRWLLARARAEHRARAAVLPHLRPGRARVRAAWHERRALRALPRRPGCCSTALLAAARRAAFAARVGGAAPAAGASLRLASPWRRSSAGRCSALADLRRRRAARRRCSRVALRGAVAARLEPPERLAVAAASPAGWPACSRPSSSTCATSSTAATCTA